MSFIKHYNNFFKNYFPSPFSIAFLLSIITFLWALFFTPNSAGFIDYIPKIGKYWFNGMFQSSLLAFTVHMMLILVFGHIIALTKTFQNIINIALKFCTSTANAVFIITFLTIIVAMFNWGLGLIFGAIFARKIGEHFQAQNKKLNYALVAASAYVGLMVWHGGLSGSAPLTVNGADHSLISEIGQIALNKTVFSTMNIFASILLITIIPSVMYFVAKKSKNETIPLLKKVYPVEYDDIKKTDSPAEKFEQSSIIIKLIGVLVLSLFIYICIDKLSHHVAFFSLLNLQTTNLMLFGLSLFFHKNIQNYLNALQEAIGDVSGILIQFPIYFGIMGIMKESGLASHIAHTMIQSANEFTLPLYTFLSSGLVNMFIPSGGGQWQIQGPIIAESALATGTPLPKMIMALAYGDQLTNMLQPFWALPLLGITGLKAKDILPYTLILFITGFCIYMLSLLIF